MTAYRQQALACAAAMLTGPRRPRDIKAAMPDAQRILLQNVYGWFVRVERGLYDLTDLGPGRRRLISWQGRYRLGTEYLEFLDRNVSSPHFATFLRRSRMR